MKQRISIVISGNHFYDPAPFQNTIDFIKRTSKENIPVVICSEYPHDSNLDKTIFQIEKVVKNADNALTIFPKLQQLKTNDPDLILSYFKLSQEAEIKNALKVALPKAPDQYLESWTEDLLQQNAYKKGAELHRLINNISLPFTLIDIPSNEFTVLNNASTQYVYQMDNKRTNHMVEIIMQQAIPKLNGKDGMIYCNVGAGHAAVLAGKIKLHSDYIKYNIISFPFFCYSKYVEKDLSLILEGMEEAYNLTSTKVREVCDKINCPTISLQELKNGSFNSLQLENIFSSAINFVEKMQFTIPKFDSLKKKTLEDLGGSIFEVEENNNAKVSIYSALLKNAVRETLGIDRMLLTIKTDFPLVQKYLSSVATITIENGTKADQLLVTFPKDKLELIEKIVYKWNDFKQENKTILEKIILENPALSLAI